MITVYLIGAPAAGKTTLMRKILNHATTQVERETPIKHIEVYFPHFKAAALGHDRYPFGGTDTLSYTAINKIKDELYPQLIATGTQVVIGEGDRLATDQFLDFSKTYGQVVLFYLDTPPNVIEERATTRAIENRLAQQNNSWVKGRITKHARLAERHNAITIPHLPLEQQVEYVWKTITAVVEGK